MGEIKNVFIDECRVKSKPYVNQTPEEKHADLTVAVGNEFVKLDKQVKELTEENKTLRRDLLVEHNKFESIKKSVSALTAEMTPVKVYHHKGRDNTTVRFLDGKSVTVHRMKGDKDSLETAIVYAIFKKVYPKTLLESLVKDVTETGGKKCKKV